MKAFKAAVLCMAILATISCTGEVTMNTTLYNQVKDDEVNLGLGVLTGSKVFFGHQSVGMNIMDGIRDIAATKNMSKLSIVEARSADTMQSPGLYHAYVGQNTDPLSKLRDFESILRGGVADAVDVAFLKFCYVDFDATTDVAAVFTAYRDTMKKLKADYPKLAIVHFSAPLTTDESGLKAIVKRIIGRKLNGYADNVKREAYNKLMRAEYDGKEPFFDIAMVEASDSSGIAKMSGAGAAIYYSLRPEYTNDGGHLNEEGRRRVASWLAAVLASVPAKVSR
jgi:lysophospholipase L1-like esterase